MYSGFLVLLEAEPPISLRGSLPARSTPFLGPHIDI